MAGDGLRLRSGCREQAVQSRFHDIRKKQFHNEEKYAVMRLRIAASGTRPLQAAMLSSMCATRPVPGIAQVTAGWLMIHFRKN
jgi:hypothetical protein